MGVQNMGRKCLRESGYLGIVETHLVGERWERNPKLGWNAAESVTVYT